MASPGDTQRKQRSEKWKKRETGGGEIEMKTYRQGRGEVGEEEEAIVMKDRERGQEMRCRNKLCVHVNISGRRLRGCEAAGSFWGSQV